MTSIKEQLKSSTKQLNNLKEFERKNKIAMHQVDGQIMLLEHMIAIEEDIEFDCCDDCRYEYDLTSIF